MKLSALSTGFLLVIAVLLTSSANAQSTVELFSNNDFEGPFGTGDVTEANWNSFAGGGAVGAGTNTSNPLSGLVHGQIEIAGEGNSFAGLQQETAVTVGDSYTFSFFGEQDAGLDVGVEFRIEWRDAANVEIPGTRVDQGINFAGFGTSYSQFSVSGTAPAGAVTGRAVIALQSFQGGTQGLVRIDDTSFLGPAAAIPEPTALAMLGLGGLGLAVRRRRS